MWWKPRHTVYLTAGLSAWGDRMWTFAVGLYMVYATPGSLRLTAVYGLVVSVSVVLFGAPVGRWVDNTPRLRAAQVSLVIQNTCVGICALLLIIGLQYVDYTTNTWNSWLRTFLQALVILIADLAALATVANKITIEKDWIVAMSEGNEDQLAWMNSAFRTIDLGSYILAPVLVGQLMTYLSPVVAAAFMAGWNVVSLVAEYALLKKVYSSCPALRREKKTETVKDGMAKRASTDGSVVSDPLQPVSDSACHGLREVEQLTRSISDLAKLEDDKEPVKAIDNGDAERSPLTSGDDAGAVEKSVRSGSGEGAAPRPATCCHWWRRRLTEVHHAWAVYFRSPFCLAGLALASLYMTSLGFSSVSSGYGYSQGLTESLIGILTAASALTGILGSLCFPKLRHIIGPVRTGVLGFSLAVAAQLVSLTSVFLPGTSWTPVAGPTPPGAPRDKTSVVVLFTGMILARFGLWLSDLSVTQILQEKVPEYRRGVVGGVQSALNQLLETTNLILVICLPKPDQFGLLIILSVAAWAVGWCFFVAYAWRHPAIQKVPASKSEQAERHKTVAANGNGQVTSHSGSVASLVKNGAVDSAALGADTADRGKLWSPMKMIDDDEEAVSADV